MGAKFAMFPEIEPEIPPGTDGDNEVDGNGDRSGLDTIAGLIDGLGDGATGMTAEEDRIGVGTGVGTDTAVGRKTADNAGEDPSGGPGAKDMEGRLRGTLVNRGPDCPVAKVADMFGGAVELDATIGRGTTG